MLLLWRYRLYSKPVFVRMRLLNNEHLCHRHTSHTRRNGPTGFCNSPYSTQIPSLLTSHYTSRRNTRLKGLPLFLGQNDHTALQRYIGLCIAISIRFILWSTSQKFIRFMVAPLIKLYIEDILLSLIFKHISL